MGGDGGVAGRLEAVTHYAVCGHPFHPHSKSLRGGEESRHQRVIIIAVALSVALGFIDTTAVGIALPSVQRDLDASTTAAHWVVIAFLLTSATLVAAAGRAADVFGRRRVYLFGLGLFTASSLLCGAAVNEWWLIAGRALQGVGSAALTPAGVALITTNTSEESQGRALGTVAAMASVGLAVGPLLGGLIIEHLGWRWIFFINAPVAVVIVVMVLAVVTESRDESVHVIDYPGLVLLTCGLFTLIFGLSRGPEVGFLAPVTLAVSGAGVLLLAVFLAVEARHREPLIRLEILRHRHVMAASTVGFFTQFAVFSLIILGVSYIQKDYGLSAFVAGLVFLPRILPQLLLSRRAGRIADARGPTVPIAVGMAMIAATLAAVSALAGQSIVVLVVAFAVVGVGVTLVDTPRRVASQSVVASEYQGVVAGINSTMTRLGAALGIAVLGSVLVALQYGRSQQVLTRAGVRLDPNNRFALDSILVNGPTGNSTLRHLPPQLAVSFRHAAHGAYTYAFTNSMRVAAVVVALAGVTAVLLLRSQGEPVSAPAPSTAETG